MLSNSRCFDFGELAIRARGASVPSAFSRFYKNTSLGTAILENPLIRRLIRIPLLQVELHHLGGVMGADFAEPGH